MEALLTAARDLAYPAEPVLVVSNRPHAEGLERAARFAVETATIDHKPFGKDREAFERAMDGTLRAARVDVIALAGFMRVLTPWFVQQWDGRMVNIHPSLLPKYPGLDTHRRALEAGDTEHGCSVHWVSEGVDRGALIDQASVPVLPDDTPQSLELKVREQEHVMYPAALEKACRQLIGRP